MSGSLLDTPNSAESEKGIRRFSKQRLSRFLRSRRALYFCIAASCCYFLLIGLPDSSGSTAAFVARREQSARALFTAKTDEYCTAADFEEGYWVERPIITTTQEAVDIYGYQSLCRSDCYAGSNKDPPQTQRALTVGSPEFTLRRNCVVRKWKYREALVRLLRMPSGIFFIGDSLTKNAAEVFDNLLLGPTSPVAFGQGLLHAIPMWRNLTLKGDHPMTADLLTEAGVSRERLDYPLITFLRTDHLLPKEELSPLLSSCTDNHVFNVAPMIEHYDWWKEMTDRLTGAKETVIYSEGVKPEHSAVVFNTGPHWNGGELGPMMLDEEFDEGYRRVSLAIAEKMESIPQELDVYFRAIAPGHTECGQYLRHNNSATSAEPPGRPDKFWYNYDQFPVWNEILRELFPTEPPAPKSWWSRRPPAPPHNWPRFLNIWDISVKRGDAHFGPGWDCLHWCPIGVPDAWATMFWHLLPLQNTQ